MKELLESNQMVATGSHSVCAGTVADYAGLCDVGRFWKMILETTDPVVNLLAFCLEIDSAERYWAGLLDTGGKLIAAAGDVSWLQLSGKE